MPSTTTASCMALAARSRFPRSTISLLSASSRATRCGGPNESGLPCHAKTLLPEYERTEPTTDLRVLPVNGDGARKQLAQGYPLNEHTNPLGAGVDGGELWGKWRFRGHLFTHQAYQRPTSRLRAFREQPEVVVVPCGDSTPSFDGRASGQEI